MEGVGGSNGNACLLSFGEHSNGFSPMIMMPSMDSCSQSNGANGNSNLFFSLPNMAHQDLNCQNQNKGSSTMVPAQHNTNNSSFMSTGYHFMENINTNDDGSCSLKAKIMSHPLYQRLLAAYVNCQKVGAPPEVVSKLEEACASTTAAGFHVSSCVGQDPALDQFMEAYCEMLVKYEQQLSKPFKEAMIFLSSVESQFKALTVSSIDYGCPMDRNGSSEEEDMDANSNNNTTTLIDPQAQDRELKGQLLRKYSGYLGSLKQEFMKKRKKGKLPKEARQQLLDWWSRHYKWPYPSEAQKLALAESTGLDQKQINNWFINQRKRHWKPSEDMQFVVMDSSSSFHHPHTYYMDNANAVLGNPFAMDISPALL